MTGNYGAPDPEPVPHEKTWLFLDNDGVINAEFPGGPFFDEEPHNFPEGLTPQGYVIRWNPEVIAALNALDVELVPATTWRQHFVDIIMPMVGLTLPVRMILHPNLNPEARNTFPSIVWKKRAIRRIVARHPGPFVHVDDELLGDLSWRRVAMEMGGLAHGPDTTFGLTLNQVKVIDQWVKLDHGH